jgi:predicted metal-dependent HD superfamily phosphohydrolase
MEALGFPPSEDVYKLLEKAYSKKHRAYHTLGHIDACLRHLDCVRDQAERPHEIELALWFHDAIYKPFSSTNEEDSADWVKDFLEGQPKADAEMIKRVFDLIILTKEHELPTTTDAKLMLDIDLSILGTAPHIYEQFENDVRYEYKRVPKFIFRKKRKEILETFLQRPKIYQTPYFQERLEIQARRNLERAITNLS